MTLKRGNWVVKNKFEADCREVLWPNPAGLVCSSLTDRHAAKPVV
jgi:hypothetical protein